MPCITRNNVISFGITIYKPNNDINYCEIIDKDKYKIKLIVDEHFIVQKCMTTDKRIFGTEIKAIINNNIKNDIGAIPHTITSLIHKLCIRCSATYKIYGSIVDIRADKIMQSYLIICYPIEQNNKTEFCVIFVKNNNCLNFDDYITTLN